MEFTVIILLITIILKFIKSLDVIKIIHFYNYLIEILTNYDFYNTKLLYLGLSTYLLRTLTPHTLYKKILKPLDPAG